MKKALIITVGVGETVADGICFSIRQNNPECIVFVLTQESKHRTLPSILKKIENLQYEEVILKDENELEYIQDECQKIIKQLKHKGYQHGDIVVDYTSGTKAMAAGLTFAGLTLNIGSISYVSGRRGEGGIVLSGTEKVIVFSPNKLRAEELFKEAINCFNFYQFDACQEILKEANILIPTEPDFQKRLLTLERLSLVYSNWERFQINKAFNILEKIKDDEFLKRWHINEIVNKNSQALYQEKEKKFCQQRIMDLYENACRRGDIEKKYDDAIARFYRLLEYLGQYRLAGMDSYHRDKHDETDTGRINIDRLPHELRQRYVSKVEIGLVGSFELLKELEDEIGKWFWEEYQKKEGQIKKLLHMRNLSILAHGFNPIEEKDYLNMKGFVESFIKRIVPNFIKELEFVKFPKIYVE